MAEAPVGPGGGPDSADPKAILRDLQQLSLVAQKLGIDLQKTAAMGQTVAGQRGNTPTSIRETHQANMPGGGTGYQNMAAGQIAGSVMAGSLPKMVQEYKDWKAKGFPDGFGGQSAKEAARHRMKHGIDSAAPGPGGIPTGTSSKKPGSKPGRHDFGQAANRRFNRQFTTIHGLMQLYGALNEPVDESRGETRPSKVVDAAFTVARGYALGEVMTGGMAAKGAYSAARAAGATRTASVLKGAARLGRAGVLVGTVEVWNAGWESWKTLGASKPQLEDFADKLNAELRPKKFKDETIEERRERVSKKFKIKQSSADAFTAAAFEDTIDWELDDNGKRIRKRSKWERLNPFRLFWLAGQIESEKKRRMTVAAEAHASATKKAEIMDWRGAIEDTQKAKEMIVAEEAMPFFWKQPEKFLRAMESSRIAGRNWARSQQPRGASRSGD